MALLPKVPQNPFPARNRTRSPLGLPGDAVVPPVPSADALQQLQDRLARGEITRVQFEAGVRALARTTATQGISPGTAAPFTAAKPPAVAHGVSAGAVPGVPVQPVSTRGEVEEPAEDEFVYEPYTPPTKAPEEMTRSEVQQEAAELTERIRRAKSSPAFARSPELVADLRRMEERLSLLSNYLAGLIPEVPTQDMEDVNFQPSIRIPGVDMTDSEARTELIELGVRLSALKELLSRLVEAGGGTREVRQRIEAAIARVTERLDSLNRHLTEPTRTPEEQEQSEEFKAEEEKKAVTAAEVEEKKARAEKIQPYLDELAKYAAALPGITSLDALTLPPNYLTAFSDFLDIAGNIDFSKVLPEDVPRLRAAIDAFANAEAQYALTVDRLRKTAGEEKFAPVTDAELGGYETQLDEYLAQLAQVTVFDLPPGLPGMPQFPGATVGPPPDISVLLGIVFDPQTGSFGKRVSPEMRAKVAALFARYEAALREYNRIEAAKARAREIADEIARENAKENAAKARFEAEHSTEAIDSWEEAAYRRQMAQDAQDALQFLMTIMQNPEWYAQLEASGLLAKYAALAGIDLPARVKAEREHVELRLRQIAEQARGQPLQKYTELLRKLSMETSWTLDELLALVPRPGVAAQTPQFRVVE